MELVQNQAALQSACAALSGATRLYLDTEFESTREGTTLCLVQISRGETIYLVDTLRLSTFDALTPILSNAEAEWVLHAGQQDVALLMARFGVTKRPRLFDTQVAWALLGAEYSVALAYLQYRVLGIRSGKAHQADDWKRRPLPTSQLAYAASDIEHLPELRRILGERAAKLDREDMVAEASSETVWPEAEAPAPLSFENFRNAWQLERANTAALKAMIDWYNSVAPGKRRYLPEPKTLLAIAGRLPENPADLARIKGVSRSFSQEYGSALLKTLHEARRAAATADFVALEPPPYASFEEIRVDGWLSFARAEICSELEVAPELVLSGRVQRPLKAALLAKQDVSSVASLLTGYRERLLRPTFLDFAKRQPPPI